MFSLIILWLKTKGILKIKWADQAPNTGVPGRMKLETPALCEKNDVQIRPVSGHVARGSAGEELRECIRSSDKKIGRESRKNRWVETISDMTQDRGT